MKHPWIKRIKKIFPHISLCVFLLPPLSARVAPLIIPRSQSVNAARELVGWQQFINLADKDVAYGALTVTAEYGESFRTARLLQCLFGNDINFALVNGATSNANIGCIFDGCYNVGQLFIQGSCVPGRNQQAWLADYFGLPTNFSSVVNFKPRIQTAIVDFDFYLGLDEWTQGLFVRLHVPLVWTKWLLCASESVLSPGTGGFLPGYMSGATAGIPNTSLRHSFLAATDGTYTWGDMNDALRFGKFTQTSVSVGCPDDGTDNPSGNTRVRLSDVEFAIGYNFLLCENYHVGALLRGSVPAGNKPCGEFVFEPIVGNGKFATLGGGITAHATLWRDQDCSDRTVQLYLDANITHLLKTCQFRSFELDGKPNSRYALIEQFASPSTTTVFGATFPAPAGAPATLFSNALPATAAGSTAPAFQYTGALSPLINKSTLDVDVSYAAQADIALKLSYSSCGLEVDLGYEFWARSKEKICLRQNTFPENTYALKGDAFIYGFTAANSATLGANTGNAIRLSATESLATIHSGTNVINGACTAASNLNPNIDFPQFAMFGLNGNPPAANTDQLVLTPGDNAGATQQRTSNAPVFIKATDLSIDCRNRLFTNKIFGNISYAWNLECYSPFVGFGGECEFAPCGKITCSDYSHTTTTCCSDGNNCGNNICGISQWGLWLKAGIAFN